MQSDNWNFTFNFSLDCERAFMHKGSFIRLVTSVNCLTVVELIIKVIGELFIGQLLYCNYREFLKACLELIHYENTLEIIFN